MTSSASMYDISLEQATNLVLSIGAKRTVLVQGPMGIGKSSILRTLAAQLPTHVPCYFDCTTKDLGDLTLPTIVTPENGASFMRHLVNEELGVHLNAPVIIMVDEFGKANASVKNAMLRLMLERTIGNYRLHPDSIIFATTNLGAEGVGDILPAHARNRIIVAKLRPSTNMEWIEWGICNGIDPALLGWVKETPQLFQSFEDVKDPEANPYIFHPRSQRAAFVTGRALEAASDILKVRHMLDNTTLTSALIGTIGARAAMDLAAFIELADKLPKLDDIRNTPKTAVVPESAAAVCMVVYRTLATISADWVDAWMTYMNRLPGEAQGLFAKGIMSRNYSIEKATAVMRNAMFSEWARANGYLFSADKV